VRPELPVATQTWALWTLGRLALEDGALDAWFGTTAARLSLNARIQALRIVAHRLRESRRADPFPPLVAAALAAAEPRVRFAALQAIAQAPRPALLDAVLAVAATETDRVTFYAAWHALLAVAAPETLRAQLRDPRGGVRRAAFLALADRGLLDATAVRAHLGDADRETAALAGLWLARQNGNPLLDISPPPGDFIDRVRVKIVPGLKPSAVRFTTDGSEPGLEQGNERANLTFTETTTLKAALFVEGRKVGPTTTGLYRRIAPPPPPPALALTPPAESVSAAAVLAALPNADAARGRAVFHAAGCVACHRVGAEGGAFGPNLTGLGSRGNVERVVRSILEPSAEIVEGYGVHTYTLRDGRTLAGRILEEGQSNFLVIQPDNQTASIARADIVRQEPLGASTMPSYDRAMAAGDLAALVAWLMRD
jgi:putative heme-binding domain-containing protein